MGYAKRTDATHREVVDALDIRLQVVPPSVTAQQKRLVVVGGRPVFFHGSRMRAEQATWEALLTPYRPEMPFSGPVSLSICLVYPHRKATPKRDQERLIPKVSKPDGANACKHLEDVLVRMRFIEDDMLVSRLVVEKWWGPESAVGIRIRIAPTGEGVEPCL